MNLIEIKDINAPEMDIFARATERELRTCEEPEGGLFLAESANVILRAIEAGYEPYSVLVETGRLDVEAGPVFETIEKYLGREKLDSLPVYIADRDVVTCLTGHTLVRGLWMALKRKPAVPVEDFCKDKRRIAVLMDVVNPVNVGAIFRSAAALGMDGVLLTHTSVDPLTRRTARVSMGTVFQIPWTFLDCEDSENTEVDVKLLKELGFKTAAMALSDEAISIDNPQLMAEEKLAVILGTEGDGLATHTIADCDYTVCIPMSHGVDSLNVAAASAVAFWQLGNR